LDVSLRSVVGNMLALSIVRLGSLLYIALCHLCNSEHYYWIIALLSSSHQLLVNLTILIGHSS
jgi:hypothetical protein